MLSILLLVIFISVFRFFLSVFLALSLSLSLCFHFILWTTMINDFFKNHIFSLSFWVIITFLSKCVWNLFIHYSPGLGRSVVVRGSASQPLVRGWVGWPSSWGDGDPSRSETGRAGQSIRVRSGNSSNKKNIDTN